MSANSQLLPCSRPIAATNMQLEQQGYQLDWLRSKLGDLDMRDLVPLLVARQVLRSHEMSAVYAQVRHEDQVDKLIEILRTKNHWLGPLIDTLIRNGQAALAEELLATNRSDSKPT